MTTEGSTIVDRPIVDLFDCMASEGFIRQVISPSWLRKNAGPPLPHLYQLTEGAIGVGTKFRFTVGVDTPSLEETVTVVAFRRPTLFVFEMTREVNVTKFKWRLQSTANGTKVTVKIGTRRETPWGRFLRPIIPFVTSRVIIDEQTLRRVLEEQC